MTMRKGGLGRGLDSLIINTDVSVDNVSGDREIDGLIRISLNDIKRNENQPRKVFNEEKIDELAESIREHGVIQPIIVMKSGTGYEIVAGERRWRAARKAGLAEIPAVVRELTKEQNMLFAIIENMQREDLSPIEEAEGIKNMIETFNLTQEEVSKSIGKSRPYITNSLRLLKLPKPIREMIVDGRISSGHGKILVAIDDEEKQIVLANKIVEESISVRGIEDFMKEKKNRKRGKPAKRSPKSSDLLLVERELKEALGTKVIIDITGKNNVIQIECYNKDELERIIDVLKNA